MLYRVFGKEILILDFSSVADQHIAQHPQGPFYTSHNHYPWPLLRLCNLITAIIRCSVWKTADNVLSNAGTALNCGQK